ncbi:MAG: sigma-70 family RNA polymerase sigma factor [Burkholderiales bacterium]|nr:sigma-70 family RNA polymerase sigma factor [Burkholderiales bacterium]
MDTINQELWASYKKNPTPKLKKEIILRYQNLVHYIINKANLIPTVLLERQDYFQFGIEGLSEAVDRFDPDHGTKFETYAIQRIRGEILDNIRKYFPKQEEFDVYATTIFPTSNFSLNHSVEVGDPDGLQLYQVLEDFSSLKPDLILEKKELKKRMLELIKELDERERTVLSLYYYECLNYKDIAQVLSITISRVSQLHSRILNKLKLKLSSYN